MCGNEDGGGGVCPGFAQFPAKIGKQGELGRYSHALGGKRSSVRGSGNEEGLAECPIPLPECGVRGLKARRVLEMKELLTCCWRAFPHNLKNEANGGRDTDIGRGNGVTAFYANRNGTIGAQQTLLEIRSLSQRKAEAFEGRSCSQVALNEKEKTAPSM